MPLKNLRTKSTSSTTAALLLIAVADAGEGWGTATEDAEETAEENTEDHNLLRSRPPGTPRLAPFPVGRLPHFPGSSPVQWPFARAQGGGRRVGPFICDQVGDARRRFGFASFVCKHLAFLRSQTPLLLPTVPPF